MNILRPSRYKSVISASVVRNQKFRNENEVFNCICGFLINKTANNYCANCGKSILPESECNVSVSIGKITDLTGILKKSNSKNLVSPLESGSKLNQNEISELFSQSTSE